jgi:hypothetical protein
LNATNFRDQRLYQAHSAYSLKYSNTIKSFRYSIGAGYLTHLNFNTTGWPSLDLSGIPVEANLNTGNVKDINATIRYQRITLLGEYLVGMQNVNINNHHPNAFSIALQYTPNIFGTNYLFGINYTKSNNLAGVPAALPGQDQLALAAAGVKNAWAVNITRSFTKWFGVGLAAERDVTYKNLHTYAYTLDLSAYL